jgi:hypothetical protein
MRNLGLALLCLNILACSHDYGLMRMEDTLGSYGAAIRWGLFERAADFQDPEHRTPLKLSDFNGIRVTGYDPIYRQDPKGSKIVRQTVQIRYYREPAVTENTVVDHQTWRFDEEKGEWLLASKLPTFQP